MLATPFKVARSPDFGAYFPLRLQPNYHIELIAY